MCTPTRQAANLDASPLNPLSACERHAGGVACGPHALRRSQGPAAREPLGALSLSPSLEESDKNALGALFVTRDLSSKERERHSPSCVWVV